MTKLPAGQIHILQEGEDKAIRVHLIELKMVSGLKEESYNKVMAQRSHRPKSIYSW